MEKEYEQEMLQNLNALELSGKLRSRLYIFGHCDASERLIDFLRERGLKVLGIADNNPAKWGMSCQGVLVASPQEYLVPVKEDTEILIVSKHYPSMNRQLMKMGYGGHIHRIVDFNTFSDYSLSEKTFMEKTARVRAGISIFEQIRIKFPQEFLLVCPYNALGDVYMALMYLPGYLDRHNIADCAIIVTGGGCLQTAQMFDAPKIEILSRRDMEVFVQALIFADDSNSMIAHHDRPYTNWNIRFSNYNRFSMENHFKVSVFGLDINAKPVLPPRRKYMDTFPFPKGKSVLLSPYAKSVIALPDEFWRKLVRKLTETGYCVLTNIANSEKALPNTIALSLNLFDTIAAVQWAGFFIGLRSGLCDVMRHAICKKIVLYPECIYSTTNLTMKDFGEILENDTANIIFNDLNITIAKIMKIIK